MIGRLRGRVDYKAQDHFLLDVNGVGYLIFCSERTLAEINADGEFTTIYTDLLVREDLMQLFGFISQIEKEWYRLLMSVQGVGAKASLAILSALGEDGVSRAIALGDWTSIKSAKGIGPKTGLKLIKEYDTIEAVCAAKDKEVPDRLDEIREIFRNHPVVEVDDETLNQGTVDVEGLKKFLVEDRQFSQKRFDNAMELLESAGLVRTGGQTSLFSF